MNAGKKEQIQDLISMGKTEEALELLETLTTDAVLLQARLNGVKRQYNMGLIDFSEWSRTLAQINYSALEMVPLGNGGNTQPIKNNQLNTPVISISEYQIFITYSPEAEEDKLAANKIKDFLQAEGMNVVSNEDIELGADIEYFVQNSIKKSEFIIVVISKDSLIHSWESGEAAINIVLERVFENNIIPVSLDKTVLDPDFYFESIDYLNEKIKKYQGYMKRAINMGEDSRSFQNDLNRLLNAKNQLAQIIEKMKKVRMVSLNSKKESSQQDFIDGMRKILYRIKTIKN